MASKNPPKHTIFAEPLDEHTLNMSKLLYLEAMAVHINRCVLASRSIPKWHVLKHLRMRAYIAGMLQLANYMGEVEIRYD